MDFRRRLRRLFSGSWTSRKKSRRLYLFGSVICLVLTLYYLAHLTKLTCSNDEIERYMTTLCNEYDDGIAMGDMCPELCDGFPKAQAVKPVACQARHFGKEVVFEAVWQENKVFVKGHSAVLNHPDLTTVYSLNDLGQKVYPDLRDFESMAENYLKDNLGIVLSGNIFLRFLNLQLNSGDDTNYLHRVMENVWTLIQANEFVFSTLFEEYDIFPEVYGSCGGVYVVEKIYQLPYPNFGQRLSFEEWSLRVKSALAVLELLDELETSFDEPLLLCDVKTDHFGLSGEAKAKLIDSDNIGFKSVIETIVGPTQNCTGHSDCDYFDCKGTCDLVKGKCRGELANNNLQNVCEKILKGTRRGVFFESPGLLSSRHMNSKLSGLLSECANPSGSKTDSRIAAGETLRKRLIKYFKEILDIAQKLSSG